MHRHKHRIIKADYAEIDDIKKSRLRTRCACAKPLFSRARSTDTQVKHWVERALTSLPPIISRNFSIITFNGCLILRSGHTAHLIPRDVFCCKQNIEMYYIAAFALPCSEPALVYTTCDAVGGAQKPAEGSNAGIGLISAKRRSRNKGRAVSLEETSEKQAMEPWTTGKHTSMDACATSASHRRCHFHVLRMDTNG